MAEDKMFFVGQKAFINKEGSVLILFNKNGKLDFPGGKIQDGEIDFNESLKREVREETNLEIDIIKPFDRWSLVFEYGHNIGKTVFLLGFICEYKSGEFKLSEEHCRYKWVDKNSYKELNNGSDNFKVLEKYFGD